MDGRMEGWAELGAVADVEVFSWEAGIAYLGKLED